MSWYKKDRQVASSFINRKVNVISVIEKLFYELYPDIGQWLTEK